MSPVPRLLRGPSPHAGPPGGALRRVTRLLAPVVLAPVLLAGETERLSVGSGGVQGNNFADYPVLSASGRFAAFRSAADNLVEGDGNGWVDIFVIDRKKRITSRVSLASDGTEADSANNAPAISRSGRVVAFPSFASNLVEGDGNAAYDVFVRDVKKQLTTRVSLRDDGGEANGNSTMAVLSGNGRLVAFESDATDLVEGDGNGVPDIFVHDRKRGTTVRVSVAADGGEADGGSHNPAFSANGRYVAFESDATNLVPDDRNGRRDVFVKDLKKGHVRRVSVSAEGEGGEADSVVAGLSASGRWVVFQSTSGNLVAGDDNQVADVFVVDLKKGSIQRASLDTLGNEGNDDSFMPVISARGRFVAFASDASNLVEGDDNGRADIFLKDLKKRTTLRASVSQDGAQAAANSYNPALSASGRLVAFWSYAANLVADDGNGFSDVFLRDTR